MEGYVAEDGPHPGNINNTFNWVVVATKRGRNQITTCTLVPLSRIGGGCTVYGENALDEGESSDITKPGKIFICHIN